MAIYRLVENHVLEPQLVQVMTTAYEEVLRALRTQDAADSRNDVVARRVAELAIVGETDPLRIEQQVLRSLDQDLLMETP